MADGKPAEVGHLAPAKIGRVTFGVRYEPQYALRDFLGSIVDAVLRTDGTRFGSDVFPNSLSDPNEHVLTDRNKRENYLQINQQDTILRLTVDTRDLKVVQKLGDDFADFVLVPLRKIGGVKSVVRTGMILQLPDTRSVMKTPPIKKYLSADFPNPTALQMKFTRRMAAEEAITKKRVEDYRNVIYTVTEAEDGRVAVGIDYQEYFLPPLDAGEIDNRPFREFVARGISHFQDEFRRWFAAELAGPHAAGEVA